MQSWRLPIILFLICLVLLGYVLFFERHQTGTAEKIFKEKRLFPHFEPDASHRINIRLNKPDDIQILLEDGQWRIEAPFKFKADNFAIDDLLWLLAELEYFQKISVPRNSTRLSQYGLSNPRVVVRVKWGKKDEIELRIGSESPTPGCVYAQIRKNDDTVYVISSEIFSLLTQPVDEWRNKSLVNLGDQQIQAIVLETQGVRYEIRLTDGNWKLTAPENAVLDSTKINTWLGMILSARAKSYCDESVQDAAKRLPPEAISSLEFYNDKNDILAGLRICDITTADNSATTVARRVGENMWMLLDENLKPSLIPHIETLRDRRLLDIPASSISKIKLTRQNKSLTLSRSVHGWKIPNYLHPLDDSAVEKFLAAIAKITLGEAHTTHKDETAENFLTLEFWQRNETGDEHLKRDIHIFKTKSENFAARVPGSDKVLEILAEDLQTLLVEADDFREKNFTWPPMKDATQITVENSSWGKIQIQTNNPQHAKLFKLLQSINVEKWIKIEKCADPFEDTVTITTQNSSLKESVIQICLCNGQPCGVIFQSSSESASCVPTSAWGSVFMHALQHLHEQQSQN